MKTPEKAGYTFSGWYNGSTKFENGIWFGLENITLRAEWTANTYKIIYNEIEELKDSIKITLDYNYAEKTDSVFELKKDEILNYPRIPTRTGYLFAGWYTDEACTNLYSFSGDITDDLTLYAKWEILSYHESVVSIGSTAIIFISGTTIKYYPFISLIDTSITVHTTGEFDTVGYLYDSSKNLLIESDDKGGKDYNFSFTYNITAGALYYIGVRSYYASSIGNVDLHIEGATDSITSTAKAVCSNVSGIVYSETGTYVETVTFNESFELFEFERIGFEFKGWYNGTELFESGKWLITNDVVLTPVWEIIEYKLSLNPNGGTVSQNEFILTYGESYELPTPVKEGYEFKGWYKGLLKYESGTWNEVVDVELLATWEIISYTISFVDYDGTVLSEKSDYHYGDTVEIPSNPSRPSDETYTYTFAGWDSEVIAVNGDKVYTAVYTATGIE